MPFGLLLAILQISLALSIDTQIYVYDDGITELVIAIMVPIFVAMFLGIWASYMWLDMYNRAQNTN